MGSQHSDTIAGSFFIKKYTGILLPGGKFIQILYLFKKPFLVHVSIPCYYKCIKRINTLNTRITEKGASYVILGLSGQASHLRTDCRKIPDADPVRSCGAIFQDAVCATVGRGIIHQSQYHPTGIYGTGAAGADLPGEGKRQFCYRQQQDQADWYGRNLKRAERDRRKGNGSGSRGGRNDRCDPLML